DQAYEKPDSSFLNRIIETSSGLPIGLSILYMAVAERVRVDLRGVSAPRHFLLRYESAEGPLYIDAFSGGRVIDESECSGWISELSGLNGRKLAAALKPVDARTIVIRMLNNLKALYVRLDKWPAAWKVQHRLSKLLPASYDERRDLALIALRANRTGQAIDLLKSCLKTCAETEREVLQSHLDEAGGQLARWN
ncbi:MAG: SirB1 family protein, partial [Planctomycetaceae bacterium]